MTVVSGSIYESPLWLPNDTKTDDLERHMGIIIMFRKLHRQCLSGTFLAETCTTI